MPLCFCPAPPEAVEEIYDLIRARIRWMDQRNIRGWNDTDYLRRFSPDYFRRESIDGHLYVLRSPRGAIQGAVVLQETDPCWEDGGTAPAFYIHNLVSSLEHRGAGAEILRQVEILARSRGKKCLRLDCKKENERINRLYEELGYRPVGECAEGAYHGILREKRL